MITLKLHLLSIFTLLFLTISLTDSYAQSIEDYAQDNYIRYDDFIYNDSVKTVLLHNTSSELSYPIIALNSDDKLELSFDDLGRGYKNYFYTVVHCDAKWVPSDLAQNEYLEGFPEDEIFDFKYSANTDIPYTHYTVMFPNENMYVSLSGNYIIMVYELNNKERPIFTKRFIVYENDVSISMNVKRATDVNESYYRQEVDFKINHEGYDIQDPFQSLNIVLMQNYRWDNAITGLDPIFIKDTELNYDYNNSTNVFDANNEFRSFDIKSTQYQTIRVADIYYDKKDGLEHVNLLDDQVRSYRKYYSQDDINGNFLIKRNGSTDSDIQADYVKVKFNLPYTPAFKNGSLYIFGKFSDWKFREELKMDYDTTNLKYTKEVLLKQGYYDYMYCFVKDGAKNKGDLSVIEGSHYETENEYIILVYHRRVNDHFDRIIGYAKARNRD